MKPEQFGQLLSGYLVEHLAGRMNMSSNTIRSYRDTFVILLRYCRDAVGKPPERLCLKDIDTHLITSFLEYLENERRCSPSTRNQRLAAIHSFMRYVQIEHPDSFLECQRILLIPSKRHESREVAHLNTDELAAILAQPNLGSQSGRRDAVLLSLIYDTGARVQEISDLKVKDIRLDPPAQVRLTGKGQKVRHVPLMQKTVGILKHYLNENGLDHPGCLEIPVFQNRYGNALSRSGMRYILLKYVEQAHNSGSNIRERVTPHTLRHTKAMHLLQAGNPLVVIQKILGHVDIKTTEIYARADMNMKRQALEKIADISPSPNIPTWQNNRDLMDWLRKL
ncbi:MAG: site-specific integrase [Armatimonadota bacterium]